MIIDPDGELHNEDHEHLIEADLCVLWAAGGFTKQGRTIVGQAEQVTFRCGPWQKGRQEQQMTQWFGRVPSYRITLDASYCAQCTDADFCALIEHELYHIAQEHDAFGALKFTKEPSNNNSVSRYLASSASRTTQPSDLASIWRRSGRPFLKTPASASAKRRPRSRSPSRQASPSLRQRPSGVQPGGK